MEVKRGENTGLDKQTAVFSILQDANVLYKLIEAGIISSATEMW